MKLQHKTQRGGTIEHTGPPLAPGETAVIPVDEEGCFEAPPELGRCLLHVLGSDVTEVAEPAAEVIKAPASRRINKEADA